MEALGAEDSCMRAHGLLKTKRRDNTDMKLFNRMSNTATKTQ